MILSFRKWFESNNSPIQWNNDISTYHRGLVRANELFPGFVHVYDPSHYREGGRKVFHDEHGEVGYALLPSQNKTEIAGVYNHGGDRTKNWGVHAIKHAAQQGGDYLEAFEGNNNFSLPYYYHRHLGVMPVGYLPWDDQYAPKNWNYDRNGRPGVVQLAIPDHGKADLDSWLSKDHFDDRKGFEAYQELLNHYKKMARQE